MNKQKRYLNIFLDTQLLGGNFTCVCMFFYNLRYNQTLKLTREHVGVTDINLKLTWYQNRW